MQIHQIRKPAQKKTRKRVARGGKRGTYSGRGMKGQKSRSGGNIRPGFEGKDTTSVARAPKIIGFTSPKLPNQEVSLSQLEKYFKEGDKVTPEKLVEKKLVNLKKRSRTGRKPLVKILGNGQLSKKIAIEGCLISKSAKEVVLKMRGTVEEISKKEKKSKKEEKGSKEKKAKTVEKIEK